MPMRRTILAGVALSTGAALTRKIHALDLTDAQIERDPMRPQYHLQPARGWMNDPCGPIYRARRRMAAHATTSLAPQKHLVNAG